MFIGGIALLVYSVEEFVENLVKTATTSGISVFLLAVIFAGMDFENWGFGISSVLKGVPDIGLGSAIGSGMFLIGVAIVIAGLFAPFRSDTSKRYLSLMILSPFVLLLFLIDKNLSRLDGLALLIIFAVILFYIGRKEFEGRGEHFRDEEVEEAAEEIVKGKDKNWIYPLLMFLFLAGIIIGSEFSVRGAKELIQAFELNGTIFGMTIVGLIMSLEEVLLVVEPVREGRESIAIGNIIGSLIFFSLGNIGILAVIRGFTVSPSVLTVYWPLFFVSVLLVGVFLARGVIGKFEAVVLGVIYGLFWVLSYVFV